MLSKCQRSCQKKAAKPMKTILLKLAGPLQAWGTDAHFETRHTDRYPSKSAVVGLIAAAFGCRRDQDEAIRRLGALHFAVRVDQPGHLAKDYQIAAKKNLKKEDAVERTYTTTRYYLEDAVFVATVGHEDDAWIETIAEALRAPYFQPFMGRRSCPVPSDMLLAVADADVLTALAQAPWQASTWYQRRQPHSETITLPVYADAALAAAPTSRQLRKDEAISFSQKHRRHRFRNEARTQITLAAPGAAAGGHDAFSALGGA